jgi:HNH endonuclease.
MDFDPVPLPQENLGPVYDKALEGLGTWMPIELVKTCKKCGEVKGLGEFYPNKALKGSREGACKGCRNKKARGRRQIPEVKAQAKAWVIVHRQNPGVKAQIKTYHKEYDKEYKQRPEVKARAKVLRGTLEAKAKAKAQRETPEAKAHNQLPEVKARKRERQNKRHKDRYDNDPVYRLACNMRARMRVGLKGHSKSKRTEQFLYCTFAEALDYLEKSFRPPMTRENMGEIWEVDHIIPVSSFDLSDPEQVKTCFHYTNLQPLFVEENRAKGNKSPEEWAAYCVLNPRK